MLLAVQFLLAAIVVVQGNKGRGHALMSAARCCLSAEAAMTPADTEAGGRGVMGGCGGGVIGGRGTEWRKQLWGWWSSDVGHATAGVQGIGIQMRHSGGSA